MIIKKYKVSKLKKTRPEIIIRLLDLTLVGCEGKKEHPNGSTMYNFLQYEMYDYNDTVYVTRKEGKIVGWTCLLIKKDIPFIGCFVDWEYREVGIGTKLVKHLIKKSNEKEIIAYPHNKSGKRLYSKFNNLLIRKM